MKKLILTTAIIGFAGTAALAKVTIQDVDVTGDGFASFEEVRNAIPGMDEIDFKAVDLNGDLRLSATEINAIEAQSVFNQHEMRGMHDRPLALLDADGDGFMSYDDIARVHPTLTKSSFKVMDANGDQRISYAEFYTIEAQGILAQCQPSTFVDMDDLDKNGDNFVSMKELKGGYPNVTNADFRTIDLNDDNRISSVELLAPTAECLNR